MDMNALISPEAAAAFVKSRAEWEQAFRDADPSDVFGLAADMNLDPCLKEFERRTLTQTAAKLLGTTYRALAADLKAETEPPKKDHRDYARETLAAFGEGNVAFSQGAFWLWRDTGIWNRVLDYEIRRAAADAVEAGGEQVTDGTVRSVIALSKDEAYLPSASFDQPAPRRINVTNGTLEYQAGNWTLRPHSREDFLTTQLPVAYDENATCPRFDRFLEEVFQGDADAVEKALAVLELMGYSLVQSCQYEKFVVLVGSGSNGKSVLLDVLRRLIGPDQCSSVEPSKLGDRVERAHLHGKLANICPELPVGSMLADAALKQFTSGDPVSAAAKFGQPFDFKPFATFWCGTNHMPHTRDLSHGMFRRAMILQFNRQFDEANREIGLADRLAGELPGILRRAVQAFAGVIERGGFTVPASSVAALQAWRTDADQVAQFLEECCLCDATDQQAFISHAKLFQAFQAWAQCQNIKHSVTGTSFSLRMDALGFPSLKRQVAGTRERGFKGIALA